MVGAAPSGYLPRMTAGGRRAVVPIFLSVLAYAGTAVADPPLAQRVEAARARVQPGDRESLLHLVIELVESGLAPEALAQLDVLEAVAPGEPRAAYWRARALVSLGRREEAEDVLRDALAPRALELRGELREERGALALALEDYLAAAAQAPSIELDLRAARLHERLGRPDEALAILEAGARRSGAAVLRSEAVALARVAGDPGRALAHVDALLAAAPSARVRVLRATILRDLGREVEARAELAQARAQADAMVAARGTALALTERAWVRIAQGDREGARRDLEQAMRLAPAWLAPRQLLATVEAGR